MRQKPSGWGVLPERVRTESSGLLPPNAGIAIGPILFVIAMLGLLASVMTSGSGFFQTAGAVDRISADIASQANLIRSTITHCNMEYELALSLGAESTVPSDPPGGFPVSDQETGTAVSELVCDPTDSSSLWGAIFLPPPTRGFNAWMYMNAGSSGGRCIWAAPTNPALSSVVQGLTSAATKFNTTATADAVHEVVYNPAGASQKFVVWITIPQGEANEACLP
ncbi:MAG: hypothetical protein PHS57_06705 [Alphaproteobacteria bacterium]|nr:hypothetical protein [Alphaproteobacteria bacterium]